MMQSGKLDRRIVVQAYTETENAMGEIVQAWADAQSLWANVSNGTGQERREAAQEQSSRVATFIVRASSFTKALTPTANRITHDGLTFDIESVVPSARRGEHISITAKARTS
jgi:SPP1 family predicted phage head-tail adaptor